MGLKSNYVPVSFKPWGYITLLVIGFMHCRTLNYHDPLEACKGALRASLTERAFKSVPSVFFQLASPKCRVFSSKVLTLRSERQPWAIAVVYIVWESLGLP